MNEEIKIYQFEDSEGNKVTPLVPERAVVDEEGIRLDQKLDGLDVETMKEELNTAKEQAIEEIEASSENLAKNVGLDEYETFSEAKEYPAGYTVMYNGLLYTFTTDHTAGVWNPDEVEDGSIKKEVEKNLTSDANTESEIKDSSDVFFFCDSKGYVIAKVNKEGIKAIDFILKNGDSITKILSAKVDKEEGKSLSSNDFTDEYREDLENILDESTEKEFKDSSDSYTFEDNSGNVIARIDKDGLNIRQIIIRDANGKEVKRINTESEDSSAQLKNIPIVCGDKFYKMQFDTKTINFLPCMYPEGIIGDIERIAANLNNGRMIYLDSKGNISTNISLQITASGYNTANKEISLIISPFSNIQNNKINVMCIGDSLTDMGYVSMMNAITDRYNSDKGSIDFTYVGTIKETLKPNLDGQTYTPRACNEGRSSWDIGNYLRHAVFTNPRPNAILSYALMTGKVAWDSLGLGSRGTDSYTYEYTGSSEDKQLIYNTCHGFYSPDVTEDLWHWCLQRAQKYNLYSFSYNEQDYNFNGRFTGSSDEPSYSGTFDANEQSCVAAFMQYIFNKPDVPFFDLGTVQTSEGKYAANFTVYISRYRTLDDNGGRLESESPQVGTLVDDVESWDVCTPTHVCLMMSYNSADFFGGTSSIDGCEQVIKDLYQFCSLIKEAFPNVNIAYACNRAYGVDFPAKWSDLGFFTERFIGAFTSEIHRLMVSDESLKSIGNYVPIFECQSIAGEINTTAISTLDGEKKIRYNGDTLHAGNTPQGWIDRASMYIAWIASTFN